jgi:hypothetical protein
MAESIGLNESTALGLLNALDNDARKPQYYQLCRTQHPLVVSQLPIAFADNHLGE